jgi:hypothetical protein
MISESSEIEFISHRESLRRADRVGIATGVLLLLFLGFWRSRNCIFWGDELFGLFVLKAPSFSRMMYLWNHGLDGSGLFFFLLGRPWIALLGSSELSLRMFSAVAVAGAFVFVWLSARRFYPIWVVAAATSYVFLVNECLRWQLSNGRSYGIFMLAAAATVYLLFRAGDERGAPAWLLFLTFCTHLLLTGSQSFGIAYSAALLGALVVLDMYFRRFRPALYLSVMAGWSVLFFCWNNIIATAAVSKDGFWTVRPALRDFLLGQTVFDHNVSVMILLLFGLLGIVSLRFRRARISSYVIIISLLLVDAVFFIKSLFGLSIYANRYLLPLSIASVFLLCEALTQIMEYASIPEKLRRALPIVVFILAILAYAHSIAVKDLLPFSDYTPKLLASLPSGLPIVDCDLTTFVDIEFYHQSSVTQIYYPIDWDIAHDPKSVVDGVHDFGGYHEMENWKSAGFYTQDILSTGELLGGVKDFVLIVDERRDFWAKKWVFNNPRYLALHTSTFNSPFYGPLAIWIVHRQANDIVHGSAPKTDGKTGTERQ